MANRSGATSLGAVSRPQAATAARNTIRHQWRCMSRMSVGDLPGAVQRLWMVPDGPLRKLEGRGSNAVGHYNYSSAGRQRSQVGYWNGPGWCKRSKGVVFGIEPDYRAIGR